MHTRLAWWVRLAAALLVVCSASAQDVEVEVERDWKLHVVGMDMGRAYILDSGPYEIVIDAGGRNELAAYLTANKLVEPPIELVVISNGDTGAWGGLRGWVSDRANCGIAEIWDAGFVPRQRRETSRWLFGMFMETLGQCAGLTIKRPLETTHAPAVVSGRVEPFTLKSLPGVTFTVLDARQRPESNLRNDADTLNLASIVVKVEVDGFTLLFPGDALGKNRDAPASAPPEYNERELLALERKYPGALQSDILAVPHSGSEASSTTAFIDAVAPRLAIFAGHSRLELPKETVVERYVAENRQLLFTKLNAAEPDKAIVIELKGGLPYQYVRLAAPSGESEEEEAEETNQAEIRKPTRPPQSADERNKRQLLFKGADLSGVSWRGARLEDLDLTGTNFRGADLRNARLEGTILVGADLRDAVLDRARLKNAVLDGAKLDRASAEEMDATRASFVKSTLTRLRCRRCRFAGANLKGASLTGAWLSEASFDSATLDGAILTALPRVGFKINAASMVGARLDRNRWNGAVFHDTDLSEADLTDTSLVGAKFIGGKLSNVTLQRANLTRATLQVEPGGAPSIRWALADWLPTLTYEDSPHTLVELRQKFKEAGLREQERILTYTIEKKQEQRAPPIERWFRYAAFDLTTRYGRDPGRPLRLLALLWLAAAVTYYLIIRRKRRARLLVLVGKRKKDDSADLRTRAVPLLSLLKTPHGARQRVAREARIFGTAAQFSAANAVNFKVQWLDAGTWLRMLRRRTIDYEATSWLRTVAAAQSLMSMYLLAIWLLTYFGRPFE